MSAEENKTAGSVRSSVVNLGKKAIVQCKGFRCLAHLGKDGKWRDDRGNVLEVLEIVVELP